MVKGINTNPRVIIHSVPGKVSPNKIKERLIAQNLEGIEESDLKFIYPYSLKKKQEVYKLCP